MSYQHGRTLQPAPSVLSVEQARRRNAELRREIAALDKENADLEAQTATMRLKVTAARRNLNSKIRALDAARLQASRLSQMTVQPSTLPEPKYGGREGLQAAADEIEAYEAKGKLGTVPRSGPRHGTGRKYGQGCRCEECLAWRVRRTKAQRATNERRRELRGLSKEAA